jgi:hypothetical protein
MKTLSQVVKENPQYSQLIRAVVRNIGEESIADVNNNGIDGGFNGFIYYIDTVKFFKRHKKDILKMAEEMVAQLGDGGMFKMVQGFRCLGKDFSEEEIAAAIYTGKGEAADIVQNAMAWFAAKEVCRMFED